MHVHFTFVLSALLACAANISFAQEPLQALPIDPAMFLQQETVLEELQLSDTQRDEAIRLAGKAGTNMRELRGLRLTPKEMQKRVYELAEQDRKALEKILKPKQLQRLNEVNVQCLMFLDWNDVLVSRLSDKLSLTADQAKKLLELEKKQVNEPKENQTLEELWEEQRAASLSILTDVQRQKLDELQGGKFDVTKSGGSTSTKTPQAK